MKFLRIVMFSILFSVAFAQSAQDMLYRAWELWKSGECVKAMTQIEKVRDRISDFPEQLQPQIEATYTAWSDTVAKDEEIYFSIISSLPQILTPKGEPLPLNAIQSARETTAVLISKAEQINCNDLRTKLMHKLLSRIDSANIVLDTYVDILIGENARLSASVDSLRRLAKRYYHLLPILDSLRTIIVKNAGNVSFLQAQLDSMVTMATQAAQIASPSSELPTAIITPVKMVSDAMLKMVENRLVIIGEARIRPGKIRGAQKDSILSELGHIATWLDTSMTAKISPQKSAAMKQLAYSYIDMLKVPQKRGPIIWLVMLGLLIVILIAIAQVFRRRG